MKISVPTFLVVGIAAYLGQLELSVHRADSVKELAVFLQTKSISPSIAIRALHEWSQQLAPPSESDWKALAAMSISRIHTLVRKTKEWFGEPVSVWLSDRELAGAMEAIGSVDQLLRSGEAETAAMNNLRQNLHTCAELFQLHLQRPAIRSKIRRIEHLNSAQHLDTLPLSTIAGPFLDLARSTPRG